VHVVRGDYDEVRSPSWECLVNLNLRWLAVSLSPPRSL
jgi:hypothetical protein